MNGVLINQNNCKSCGYCVAACPKKALTISEQLNSHGYQFVTIDEERCIQCGICYTVCPDYVFTINTEGGK